MEHTKEIYFKNVYLRPLMERDIESLRAWRNNPDNSVYLNKLPFITSEMQKKWFNEYKSDKDNMCFAIVECKELNRLVGSLSLYAFKEDECLFGKLLIGDKDAHGRSIGLNATIAACTLAFQELQLKRINLFVYADNLAAYHIYLKAGFQVLKESVDSFGGKEYLMCKENEGNNSYA